MGTMETRHPGRIAAASFVLAAVVPIAAHADCFTVVDAKNRIVYQSTSTPVNLAGSIGTEMARRYPGRHLIISPTGGCVALDDLTARRSDNPAALLDARASGMGNGVVEGSFSGTSPAPVSNARPSSYPDGTINDGLIYGPRSGNGDLPTYPGSIPGPSSSTPSAPAPARLR